MTPVFNSDAVQSNLPPAPAPQAVASSERERSEKNTPTFATATASPEDVKAYELIGDKLNISGKPVIVAISSNHHKIRVVQFDENGTVVSVGEEVQYSSRTVKYAKCCPTSSSHSSDLRMNIVELPQPPPFLCYADARAALVAGSTLKGVLFTDETKIATAFSTKGATTEITKEANGPAVRSSVSAVVPLGTSKKRNHYETEARQSSITTAEEVQNV